jgi:hypothetical protein
LLNYNRLSRKPLLFRSFTGLELPEFDSICKEVESKYPQYEIKRLSKRKNRTRGIGAGNHFKLQVRDRFLMLLVYYRLYITHTLSGFLFDLDQSNVYRDMSHIEQLVKSCIPLPKKLYNNTKSTNKKRRLRTIEDVEKHFPGFKAFVDSTEQEIPRPKKKKKKKEFYSGKKKRHTIKTQYMVNGYGLILHKTGYKRGRRHDYDIYKEEHPVIPSKVENVVDLGYLGCEKDFSTVKYSLPVKKKRNTELTEEEKEYNKNHSRLRVIIEHTICRIKKFCIMGTKYRNRLERYNTISDIVSGLVNYRIMNSLLP